MKTIEIYSVQHGTTATWISFNFDEIRFFFLEYLFCHDKKLLFECEWVKIVCMHDFK